MIDGPAENFVKELEQLIQTWREKPIDDQLSYAEIIAALEITKNKLILENIIDSLNKTKM